MSSESHAQVSLVLRIFWNVGVFFETLDHIYFFGFAVARLYVVARNVEWDCYWLVRYGYVFESTSITETNTYTK